MRVLFILMIFFSPSIGFAGGPISVMPSTGEASVWNPPIDLHPEAGICGSFSNTLMITKLGDNVAFWENVTGISLSFSIVQGTITEDVDGNNFDDYFVDDTNDPGFNDGINPIIFDDDGAIVVSLFGASARFTVLGFAGPDEFTSDFSTIVDGQAFFNCRCLIGNAAGACPAGIVFTDDDQNFTQTHEIGHLIGLDHTEVNQNLASNCSTNNCDDLPTMFPQSVDAAAQISPHRDDEVAVLTLYGLAALTAQGYSVTGSLQDKDGNALRCADVQAVAQDVSKTISAISGANAPFQDLNGDGASDGTGECLSKCGDFELRGLDPNETYTITVKPIDSSWVGGSSVGPCVNGQPTGVVEEILRTINSGTQSTSSTVALGTLTTNSSGGSSSSGSSSSGSFSSSSCSISSNGEAQSEFLLMICGLIIVMLWRMGWLIRGRA